MMRATGTLAFLMLHVILCIGPLVRLDRRFAPLLYNRRHFGVAMFSVALFHALLTTLWYHGFGVVDPLTSLLTSNTQYGSWHAFPFETLGLLALLILFLMAATSHDFWLANLKPAVWKSLHMLVYLAYGLLVMHVILGALQSEKSIAYPVLTVAGVCLVVALHVMAGLTSRLPQTPNVGQWVDVGDVASIPENRARVVQLADSERIAVYKYDGKLSAVSNVCAHQAGPLGEGKVINGCITCPWHGYQYRPEDGQSPPPYSEKIPTYKVRVEDGRVLLHPKPLEPGTRVQPATIEGVQS